MDSREQVLTVLVVDDEEVVRMVLERLLTSVGYQVETAEDLGPAREAIQKRAYDLYLIDKNLPAGSGIDLVKEVREAEHDCEVVVITGYANVPSAVDAMRLGVADYIVKPFESLDELTDRLRRATERLALKRENATLVDELQQTNTRLEELATRDGLTELYNHAYFQERLEAEMQRSHRHDRQLGLVFIDVDSFKEVNDSLGHQVGDAVLRRISGILRGETRSSDEKFRLREHDLAARYGGDEFVLLLPETPKSGAATKAEYLRRSIEIEAVEGISVTVSMGVAAYPVDGADRRTLIEAADTALYAAKRLGRNRVMSYSSALAAPDENTVTTDQPTRQLLALDRSVAEGLFVAVFQPVVAVSDGTILGHEALNRPTEADLGSIEEALAAAESVGRVRELGRALRTGALAALTEVPAGSTLFLNLHPHELYDPSLVTELEELGSLDRLVLELSFEAHAVAFHQARSTVDQLRERGVRLSVDRMPATYASLDAMTVAPLSFIKIDISVCATPRSRQMVQHALEVCEREGITAVAKRVETEEQFAIARDLGFAYVQGYYVGHPVEARSFESWKPA